MEIVSPKDLKDSLIRLMKARRERAPFVERIVKPSSPSDRWDAIRSFYDLARSEIMASPPYEWAIDPYEVDWSVIFTPIEFGLWQDIRSEGAVLYPQFPIGKFFVDFANPVARVAIECDGAKYHLDTKKDRERQAAIESLNWTVYRITGRDCLLPDVQNENGDWVSNPHPARQFIPDIARAHFLSTRAMRRDDDGSLI
jgi:hypothetical protein